jgi:hypothetical protein
MTALTIYGYLTTVWRGLSVMLDELSLSLKETSASLDRANASVEKTLWKLRWRRERHDELIERYGRVLLRASERPQ